MRTSMGTPRPARTEDLYVSSGPSQEPCAQVGSDGYAWRAWHQCRALLGQLRRVFGPEPPGCRLYIHGSPHDRTSHLTVHCSYRAGDERGRTYALRCRDECPVLWDPEARAELGLDPVTPATPEPPAKKPRPKRVRKAKAPPTDTEMERGCGDAA